MQQIAEAITAVLELETEIIDEKLTIVAGTGRYKKKIGAKEEDGDLDSGYILENALEYAASFEKGARISVSSIQPRIQQASPAGICTSLPLAGEVEKREKEIILKQLAQTGYTTTGKRAAAKNLGISESTLYRRIRKLGIQSEPGTRR